MKAVPLHPEAVGFADHYDFDIEVPAAYRPTGKVTGRTWVEKGRTSIVRRTGNPFSVNAMSAISTKGRTHFMVFTETFDADVVCRFLDRIAGHFGRTVHLVLDGHAAHRSRKVRIWLADHPLA